MTKEAIAIVGGILAVASILCIAIGVAVFVVGRRQRTGGRGQRPDGERGAGRPFGEIREAVSGRTPAESLDLFPASEGPRPALIGLSEPYVRRVFAIPPAPSGLTIGRSPDNGVILPEMLAVSRYHAQVVPEEGVHVLYDRNSANGTAVNDKRVFRHELKHGDRVQVCGARFVFSQSGRVPSDVCTPSGLPSLTQDLFLDPGARFEGYVIDELLGEGGMSVVYRAHDPHGKVVAIKILNVVDEYAVRKFVQEQEIGAVLHGHPHIRTVNRLGRSPDRNLYLVMEFVDGYPLRRLIGTLSDEEVVDIMGQTCVALGYAHQHRIVHRDIKPENILLTHDGDVKVTDFGVAKLTSSVTVTSDRVVGTPEYLSPEQARGDQRIKPISDIYSLGIVLYELLTGQVPFPLPKAGDPYQAAITVLRHHVRTPAPSPRQHNPKVTPWLEKVTLRAIEKDPRRRYPTALAMSEALGYVPQAVVELVEPASVQRIGLVVTKGARVGHSIAVNAHSVTIGRMDLDPQDTHVSRQHTIMSLRGGRLWLEDTSLNGTRVNGERVFGQVMLRPGDEIRIGRSELRVRPSSQ